ncbi:MAG: sigma-54 dependent transcriptional regulator [Planctomycetota bacterium]
MNLHHVAAKAAPVRPLVGVSDWARRIQSEISEVAPYPTNILICGPTGTGKEVIARSIHERSPRAEGPFVPVNCAAIAPTLFESHMFGHLKGSFTGASHEALGCFRAADGGTLFLDEIGELELELQAKLLRVLQEQVVTPVGGHEQTPIDVRIVSATNRGLSQEVAKGRFRQDLFYRIAVATLQTVPLAQRPDDLKVLSQFLIARLCRGDRMPFKPLSTEAEERLQLHPWPGNVRELQNVLERALMLAKGSMIEACDIVFDTPAEAPGHSVAAPPPPEEPPLHDSVVNSLVGASGERWATMKRLEKWHIEQTLKRTGHNQAEAARLLGMNRGSLRRRIQEFGIEPPSGP